MPALIAHHLLGLDVLAELRAAPLDPMAPPNLSLPLDPAVEAAFLLGCQGPDPFFYTVFHRELVKIRKFGSRLHQERVAESLDSLRSLALKLPPTIQPLLTAYIRGWLCHFTLDSQAHPFVNYLVQEFCSAGIPGLDENATVEVHSQIESDLDSSLLYRHNSLTINTFRPMDEILLCDKHTVYWISVLYRLVAARVFAIRLP
ncbi:MAG: zinc dependent phospholipase C family protein, partial [Coriobacteriales bacterium]|nr:zinc dependent phospholipase C family protein [Coriobacteriales bacterium]